MLKELSRLANEEQHCYMVAMDLFEAIDSKQDQVLDLTEWSEAFNTLASTDPQLAVKTTPMAVWQNSFEA